MFMIYNIQKPIERNKLEHTTNGLIEKKETFIFLLLSLPIQYASLTLLRAKGSKRYLDKKNTGRQ